MIKVLKYDPYLQTTEFIQWIESYANDGWFINGLNQDSLLLSFKKKEPKQVRYTIYAIENTKLFNKEEFLEIARHQGWDLVGNGTYLRELYLFVNMSENPIPIETDPIEQSKKNENLKRLALWSLGLSVLTVAIWGLPTNGNSNSRWLPILAYSYLAILHIIQALRTGYASNESKEKRNHIARSVKLLRIGFISSIILFLMVLGLRSMHFSQQLIDKNPLVKWNLTENQSIVNESYSTSRFSFIPNSTSLVIILEEGHLTRSIYQTKQNFLWFTVQDFHKLIDENIDWFIYNDALKYETKQVVTSDRVLFQSINRMEFWSFIRKGNTYLTLHTINLTQEEHQALLEKMERDV